MSWPADADGDVFRRLEASGFNFSAEYAVDYNVDFPAWPPPQEAIRWLQQEYGNVELYPPEVESDGYALFRVRGFVTYERVTGVQQHTSAALAKFGGVCESWGVLH